ncbi:MAG: hypothetical protein U9Q68_08395 [Euryarchaeota archaeon]|nr:hypothetical protein [Euryarchaeota archaeon]
MFWRILEKGLDESCHDQWSELCEVLGFMRKPWLLCWMAVRMRKSRCGGTIQALVIGTTVVNGTIEPILEMAQDKAVFHGINIVGVARLLGLERFGPRSA